MPLINVGCKLVYAVEAPASFVFSIASAMTPHQEVRTEDLYVSSNAPYDWCELGEPGYRSIRLHTEPTLLTLEYTGSVELHPDIGRGPALNEVEHKELPASVLPYLNPSRYCESDRLNRFAAREFGPLSSGYARVDAICAWINARIEYVPGSTDASSSACDVLLQRAGVCRDFAHVGIALCRALGIPARYVSGYAVGLAPPDFHGFFEAFLAERWYLFDATRMVPVSQLVRIGVGRDAADAAFATIVGQATLQTMAVLATAGDSQGTGNGAPAAISTA